MGTNQAQSRARRAVVRAGGGAGSSPRGNGSARLLAALTCGVLVLVPACADTEATFDARSPAAGPGSMVGARTPLNTLAERPFRGGDDALPSPHATPPLPGPQPPDCGPECRAHCDAVGLENPVNRGLCPSLWGVGLNTLPIDTAEACRRLFADTLGRFPTLAEIQSTCLGRPYTEVVSDLLSRDEFVHLNQRRWADRLLYNNEALSPVRIYDADLLVEKLYRGLVAYDEFATVVSAHPVLTRRYATPGDRAEAFFRLFTGRPPFEHERADLARLYVLWDNGYYEHPSFGRVPDAFIRHRCLTDDGERDPVAAGQCASVLWGYRELILLPDIRTEDERLWSGLLSPAEWTLLQEPGRIVSAQPAFWERAVDDVLEQYLGYRLGVLVPAVREHLIDYLLEYGADIRAVHFAVLTSAAYLQSARTSTPDPVAETYRYTSGPLKQAEVETWIDTIEHATQTELGSCDHRLPDPRRVLDRDTIGGYALIQASNWPLRDDGARLDTRYLELARSLGGCPENLAGGRFKAVSILTTATQEGFVTRLCNPALLEDHEGLVAPAAALLPPGMPAQQGLTENVALQILEHQLATFFSRTPVPAESIAIGQAADECAPKPCTAEAFARPLCFSLLSSAEMLFY